MVLKQLCLGAGRFIIHMQFIYILLYFVDWGPLVDIYLLYGMLFLIYPTGFLVSLSLRAPGPYERGGKKGGEMVVTLKQ